MGPQKACPMGINILLIKTKYTWICHLILLMLWINEVLSEMHLLPSMDIFMKAVLSNNSLQCISELRYFLFLNI